MRGITGIGLVLAFVVALLAIPYISGLQDEGEALGGVMGTFFSTITPMAVIIFLGVLGFGTVAVTFALILRR